MNLALKWVGVVAGTGLDSVQYSVQRECERCVRKLCKCMAYAIMRTMHAGMPVAVLILRGLHAKTIQVTFSSKIDFH